MATTISPIKILSDLGLNPWEIENDEDYLRALKEGIITIEASTKGKGDKRSVILREELIRVRKEPKKTQAKEKKTTIKAKNFLPGTTFRPEDIKPVDVDKIEGDSPALMPDRLDNIAKTVDSIALLLRRQFNLETKQQRDARVKQDKINKQDREDDLEKKPKDKKTGGLPKAIAKPALNFFERIKNFFLNIAIGSAVFKMLDWLKDPGNAEKIAKFTEFLINNAPLIIGGLAAIALLPVLSSIMGVLGALKSGLLLLKPALALLFSPAGLAALALAAGLGGTLLAMKFIFDKSRDFATGGKNFTSEHKSLDERLKEAGMNRGGQRVERRGSRTFLTGKERTAEQEELFQEVQAERKRLNDLHTAMDNEVKYTIAITPHDVPARKQGRQKYASKVSKEKQKEIRTKVEAKYNKMIETGGVAPKQFLTKESTNLLIEKHKKTGETLMSSEDNRISNEKSSATIDKTLKKETNISPPNTTGKGNTTIIGGGGDKQQSVGGGGGTTGSSAPSFSSQDPNNLGTFSTQGMYNMVG